MSRATVPPPVKGGTQPLRPPYSRTPTRLVGSRARSCSDMPPLLVGKVVRNSDQACWRVDGQETLAGACLPGRLSMPG